MVWISRIGEINTRPESKSRMLFVSRTKQLALREQLRAIIYNEGEMLYLIQKFNKKVILDD